MEKFLTGREMMELYQLRPFQLLKLIEQGLEPHDPSSGRPCPSLTEPEFWLYRVQQTLWSAAGLMLLLYDSDPKADKLTPNILAQMPHIFHRALSRLAANKPPDAGLYQFQPERRLPRRKLPRLAAWLLSGILDQNDLTRDYRLTSALLQAACPHPKASLFDLAASYSRSGLPAMEKPDSLDAEFASDVLDRLLSEQERGSFIDNALLEKILIEDLPLLPLANFCQEYPHKVSSFSNCRPLEDFERMERIAHNCKKIEGSLRMWYRLDNSQRLIALSVFSRLLRRHFPSTPLPLRPGNEYLGLVLLPEEFERLQECVFKAKRLTALKQAKEEEQLSNNIAIANISNIIIGSTGRRDTAPVEPDVNDPPSPLKEGTALPEEAYYPPPAKEIESSLRSLADKYRALKTETRSKKCALALEAMGRKIEGWHNWQIFRELGLEKTKLMVELEAQIRKGEDEVGQTAEKRLRQTQREKISKLINKYGEPFVKIKGLDWQKDNPDSRKKTGGGKS